MGLMPTPTQGPTQGPPFADPNAPAQGAQQEDQSNVSPEEQQAYDTVMGKAAELIYGKGQVMPQIVDALKPAKSADEKPDDEGKGGNPAVLALANTAVQVVSKLDASSKEQGFQIPDDVLYHAGSEIVAMLAEVAEAAGIHDYSEEEINGAFLQAVDNYRPIAEQMGRTDDATLKQQFGEIEQADEQGQLGQLLPGIDQVTGQQAQSPQG